MSLSIIQQPTIAPISNDLLVAIEDTDFKLSSGTPAIIVVTITSPTQNIGDYIVLGGQRFDVGTVNDSATVDMITPTTTLQAAQNLETSVLSNWYLGQRVTTVINAVASGHEIVVTFVNTGVQENFSNINMFTNTTTIVGVNGTNNTYKDGGNILVQVYESPNTLINIMPIKVKPDFSTSQATVFLRDVIKNRLRTANVNFSCNDQPYLVLGHLKEFFIRYTSIENRVPCGVKYGNLMTGDTFKVFNIMLDDMNETGLIPYYFQNVAQMGTKLLKWLTYRGLNSTIECDTCGYVHFINLTTGSPNQIKYQCFVNGLPSPVQTHSTLLSQDGTYAIPLNLFQSFITPNTTHLEVWISNGIADLTEKIRFAIERGECETASEIYFLNDFGVYEFLNFDAIGSYEIAMNGTEICSDINTNDSFNLVAQNGGKSLINIDAEKIFTISVTAKQRTGWWLNMIEQLIKSPSVFLRFSTTSGVFKRKIIIQPDTYTIYDKDEKVFFDFRYKFHNDIKIANY